MGPKQSLPQIDSDEEQNDPSQGQGKLWGVLQPVITPTKKILKNKGTLISLMKAKKFHSTTIPITTRFLKS